MEDIYKLYNDRSDGVSIEEGAKLIGKPIDFVRSLAINGCVTAGYDAKTDEIKVRKKGVECLKPAPLEELSPLEKAIQEQFDAGIDWDEIEDIMENY